MGLSGTVKRSIGVFFLVISLAFGIAAMTSNEWIHDYNGSNGKIHIGLRSWDLDGGSVVGDPYYVPARDGISFDDSLWHTQAYWLGSSSAFKRAGMACTGIGAVAIILAGFALFLTIIAICRHNFPHQAVAGMGWLSGLLYILGAIVYEGVKPTFVGNEGYQWPMGLYLTAGIAADIAAFFAFWAGRAK